jgi:solute carrier family 45 protein 1/2/4
MMFVLLDPMMNDLKLSQTHISIIWSIGPVVGFFVQPITAYYSDRCKSRFGRRTPYIVAGCVLSAFFNVILFVLYHFRKQWHGTAMLVGIYITVTIAYTTENVFDVCSRSLMLDLVPPEQEHMASTLLCGAAGVSITLSNLLGGLGYFIRSKGYQDNVPQYLFIIGSVMIVVAVPVTICCAKEKKFEGHIEEGGNVWVQMIQALRQMPRPVLLAAFNQLVSNLAFYPSQMKTTSLFKFEVFPESESEKGLCFGMLFLAIAGAVNMFYGFLQIYIMKKVGPKIPYVIGHVALTLCCFGIFFTLNRWLVAALMVPVWICTAMLFAVPYAVMSEYTPPNRIGVCTGLITCFVCIGEQAAVGVDAITVIVAKRLPKKWNIKENRANIGGGMFAAFVGLMLSIMMAEPKKHEEEEKKEYALITTPLLLEGKLEY